MGVGGADLILGPDHQVGSFTVGNNGDTDIQVEVTAYDFVMSPDGSRARADKPTALGAATWMVPTYSFTILHPGEMRKLTFSLVPPPDAAPGDHYAGVQVTGAATDAAYAALGNTGDSFVTLRSRIGYPMTAMTRVPGEVTSLLSVAPFDSFLSSLVMTADGAVEFSPEIVNDGNVAAAWVPANGPGQTLESIAPTLKLHATGGLFATNSTLFDGKMTDEGKVTLSPLVVLPGATHTQHLTMTDAPLFGTYDYVYTLPGSAADGRETITQTGHFTIVNLQKVLLWIVLPLLVLMTLFALVMIRRHHTTTKRRMAEALRQRELQQARQEAYELARREQQHQGRGPW